MNRTARPWRWALVAVTALVAAAPSADAVRLYNAACSRALGGDLDRGAALLAGAVKAGFGDFSHVRRDPDLRALHDHPVYRALLDARDACDERLAQRRLARWRKRLDPGAYRRQAGPARVEFLTCLDEAAHAETLGMIETLASDASRLGLPEAPRQRVLVVIARPADAAALVGERHAHGVYRHGEGVLVADDPGRGLRHEFIHALHHAHMDELGQQHPIWIQEGLALLFEHYHVSGDGTLTFLPNDRDEAARDLAARGRLIPWTDVLAMTPRQLNGDAARAYPQLRSMLGFVAEQGALESWYRAYVEGYDDDPSGAAALEGALGRPLADIEALWRAWLLEG